MRQPIQPLDKAESEPELAAGINAVAPGILAEEGKRLGALLLHYSTDDVYDGLKATPYVETDPTGPQSVYGRSKLAGEEAIRAVGGKSVIFRTSWVFGARGGNFVKTILRLAREKESLNVVDDQLGSPTPAALIATVTGVGLAMLRHGQLLDAGESRLYHLAAARPVSWCDLRTDHRPAGRCGARFCLAPQSGVDTPDCDRPVPDPGLPPGQFPPRLPQAGKRFRLANARLAALPGTHAAIAGAEAERLLENRLPREGLPRHVWIGRAFCFAVLLL